MDNLPMGFGMALLQLPEAAKKFEALSREEQQKIVDHTHDIHSKQEMQAFVHSLIEG